jgi:2-oxoglutarate ferredoxin oxidoreductase subunit gamma
MRNGQVSIQFCGDGGQGIILSAVVFGTVSVTKACLHLVKIQSYGFEASGEECQAAVIVSDQEINSPVGDKMDILVAMSQPALDKYLPRLKSGGTLIYDPEFVWRPDRPDITSIDVEATKIGGEIGVSLTANMVMLGFLQAATDIFSESDLNEVISENVPGKFVAANLQAARRGMQLAKDGSVVVEV